MLDKKAEYTQAVPNSECQVPRAQADESGDAKLDRRRRPPSGNLVATTHGNRPRYINYSVQIREGENSLALQLRSGATRTSNLLFARCKAQYEFNKRYLADWAEQIVSWHKVRRI